MRLTAADKAVNQAGDKENNEQSRQELSDRGEGSCEPAESEDRGDDGEQGKT